MSSPFDDRGENFLSRWSRRKRAEPEKRDAEDRRVGEELAAESGVPTPAVEPAPIKPPADLPAIESLTPASDFSRFMRPDVPMASRSAAVKKLFADPHFNVMDGLDTYIDDYTRPDPIPAAMLRELAQSRMLKLFDDETDDDSKAGDRSAVAPLEPPAATVVTGEGALLSDQHAVDQAGAKGGTTVAPGPANAPPVGLQRDARPAD